MTRAAPIQPEGPPTRQMEFVPGFALDNRPPRPASPVSAASPPGSRPPTAPDAPGAESATGTPPGGYAEPAARQEADLLSRLRERPAPRVLCQVDHVYILAEIPGETDAEGAGLLLIDQHAAHEKILYLSYMRAAQARQSGIEVQPLLAPYTLELAPAEAEALEELAPALRGAGFDVEPFGGGTWLVQSLPTVFEGLDGAGFIRDLLDDVGEGDLPRELGRLRQRICARAACRAAVKSGDRLTREEMQQLVEDLLTTADALRCPHGRPTVLLMTRAEIDRQFGRLA